MKACTDAPLPGAERRSDRKSVLMLMSSADIIYAMESPDYLEVNAALVSTGGKVAMQGVQLSNDGKKVSLDEDAQTNPGCYVKESIRRLGGIVSRERPVDTVVNERNQIVSGFRRGTSIMDRSLVLEDGGTTIPPGAYMVNRPTWSLQILDPSIEIQGAR